MARYAKISVLAFPNPPMPQYIKVGEYGKYEKEMMEYLSSYIDNVLPDCPDLIILPECSNRFLPDCYESRAVYCNDIKKYYRFAGEKFVDYMRSIAKNNNVNIAYSATRFVPESEKYRNSTVYIDRKGETAGIYDKNHLMVEENTECDIEYGKTAELIKLDFAKAATAICFDLNFDELLYKYKAQEPELVVFSSAYHGGLRQEQWAYLCRAYFASSVLGKQSRILNPYGKAVAETTNYTPYATGRVNFDYKLCHLDYNAEKFERAKHKYKDALSIYDPGYVGSVMLSSEDESMTVEEIINEFEIETLDSYFERALSHRKENI